MEEVGGGSEGRTVTHVTAASVQRHPHWLFSSTNTPEYGGGTKDGTGRKLSLTLSRTSFVFLQL